MAFATRSRGWGWVAPAGEGGQDDADGVSRRVSPAIVPFDPVCPADVGTGRISLESAVWCFCLLLDGDSEELSRRAEDEHRICNCNGDVLIGR